MTKKELCAQIAERTGLKVEEADSAVKAFVDIVTEEMARGGSVQLLGFGTFKTNHREARMVRNPGTGEMMQKEAVNVPTFKAGGALKEKVNA